MRNAKPAPRAEQPIDPAFEVIQRHERVRKQRDATHSEAPGFLELDSEEANSWLETCQVRPTTAAGMAALLRHVVDYPDLRTIIIAPGPCEVLKTATEFMEAAATPRPPEPNLAQEHFRRLEDPIYRLRQYTMVGDVLTDELISLIPAENVGSDLVRSVVFLVSELERMAVELDDLWAEMHALQSGVDANRAA